MFSIYTSCFNIIKNDFDYQNHLRWFVELGDEVVVACNKSEDGTLDALFRLAKENNKIKVIDVDFAYNDPDMDGKIKNAALQATSYDVKIGLDLDERPMGYFFNWSLIVNKLLESDFDCIMLPSINLFKDINHYKSIGQKWYLHKKGLYRGTANFAKNIDGTHDIEKSDSCELIDKNGNLVKSLFLINPALSNEEKIKEIEYKKYPYVLHYGYLNLEKRVLRNKNFWKNHWNVESGKEVNVPTTIEEIDSDEIFEHQLLLGD